MDTCYRSVIPDVKVRQAPSNGNIEIIPAPAGTRHRDNRCSGRKVRGLAYVYTPKKGFKGMDEFSIDVPWASTDTGPKRFRPTRTGSGRIGGLHPSVTV